MYKELKTISDMARESLEQKGYWIYLSLSDSKTRDKMFYEVYGGKALQRMKAWDQEEDHCSECGREY